MCDRSPSGRRREKERKREREREKERERDKREVTQMFIFSDFFLSKKARTEKATHCMIESSRKFCFCVLASVTRRHAFKNIPREVSLLCLVSTSKFIRPHTQPNPGRAHPSTHPPHKVWKYFSRNVSVTSRERERENGFFWSHKNFPVFSPQLNNGTQGVPTNWSRRDFQVKSWAEWQKVEMKAQRPLGVDAAAAPVSSTQH
jgi:hypothetical protein